MSQYKCDYKKEQEQSTNTKCQQYHHRFSTMLMISSLGFSKGIFSKGFWNFDFLMISGNSKFNFWSKMTKVVKFELWRSKNCRKFWLLVRRKMMNFRNIDPHARNEICAKSWDNAESKNTTPVSRRRVLGLPGYAKRLWPLPNTRHWQRYMPKNGGCLGALKVP